MKSCFWDNDGLYLILSCCPGLEVLSLEAGESSDDLDDEEGDDDDDSGFDFARIGSTLCTHTKNLKYLSIDTRAAMGRREEEFPSFIRNLQRLGQLQTVRLYQEQIIDCREVQESWEQISEKLQLLLRDSVTDVVLLNNIRPTGMPDQVIFHEPGKLKNSMAGVDPLPLSLSLKLYQVVQRHWRTI